MNISKMAEMLRNERFPRSARYDPQWVLENEMGPNALWLTEWLCECMDLKPGMRVLDMGCSRAASSIFLAKEFGVQVWANDPWVSPSENWQRIREAGVDSSVFPIQPETQALLYASDFFDAIVSVDSFHYHDLDDAYLRRFLRFLKSDGWIGVVVPAVIHEVDGEVPEYLTIPALLTDEGPSLGYVRMVARRGEVQR